VNTGNLKRIALIIVAMAIAARVGQIGDVVYKRG
jgi:hypothetical protein